MEALSTNKWEAILNAVKRDNASGDCQGVEDEQMERRSASQEKEDFVEATLQKVIADQVMQQIESALKAIPKLVEEAVDQLFRAATLSVQGENKTMVYYAMKHAILEQIRMSCSDRWSITMWINTLKLANLPRP